jgi:hypothetical protein
MNERMDEALARGPWEDGLGMTAKDVSVREKWLLLRMEQA